VGVVKGNTIVSFSVNPSPWEYIALKAGEGEEEALLRLVETT
jgi:hypothetical protein